MENKIAHNLSHILWIGGSPCSGKSTIAAALAERHGFAMYTCDDMVDRHTAEAGPDRAPTMHRLGRASCDELWMRPLGQQVREEMTYYDEEFPFILDDLLAKPRDRPVIVEGAALMPHLLDRIDTPSDRSIWILPSPAFQRAHYARRDWRHDVLATCTEQDQAWHNWMARDIGFATAVAAECLVLHGTCLTIDGTRPVSAILDEVTQHFRLP